MSAVVKILEILADIEPDLVDAIEEELGTDWQTQVDGEVDQTLVLTKATLPMVFASAKQSNTDTNTSYNCTVARTNTGRYTVSFSSPHPNGTNYEVLFGQFEGTNRDVPKVSVVQGTETANGFNVQVTIDDNGGTADIYSSDFWSFAVLADKEIITNVTLS